jgi:hypothetical protein
MLRIKLTQIFSAMQNNLNTQNPDCSDMTKHSRER